MKWDGPVSAPSAARCRIVPCLIVAPCSTRYPVPNSQLQFTPLAWPIVFLLFTYFISKLIGFLLESIIVFPLSLSLLSGRFGAQR